MLLISAFMAGGITESNDIFQASKSRITEQNGVIQFRGKAASRCIAIFDGRKHGFQRKTKTIWVLKRSLGLRDEVDRIMTDKLHVAYCLEGKCIVFI